MILGALTALFWILLAGPRGYPLGIEPLFPALSVSLVCLGVGSLNASRR